MRKLIFALLAAFILLAPSGRAANEQRRLYVTVPGIRNYVEYGGIGVLVYDIDRGHRFIKRIPTLTYPDGVAPEAVKGVAAHARSGRLYFSTPKRLVALDLNTEQIVWNREFEGGCDRMSLTPDGKMMYLPSYEGPHWHVVDTATGDTITKIVPNSGAHNTVVGQDGRYAYLAGLKSPLLRVVDTNTNTIVREVGPFSHSIRPFTVNGSDTLCFVNVNELLGFEIGDIKTGKMLHRIEVPGYEKGKVKRHGCPSHGIGLTPDEREIWLTDAANSSLHVFDNTVMPPKYVESVKLRDQPGWVTFTLNGEYAYPSTGDVINVKTRKIVATLSDETGREVQSEKLLEIDFADGKPVRNADQFGVGRKRLGS